MQKCQDILINFKWYFSFSIIKTDFRFRWAMSHRNSPMQTFLFDEEKGVASYTIGIRNYFGTQFESGDSNLIDGN